MSNPTQKDTPSWEELARSKREAVATKIPEAWRLPSHLSAQITEQSTISVLDFPRQSGLLSAKELEITEDHDACDLLQLLKAGTLSSVEVAMAFCKRAAIAQQCVGCLTEIMFDEAMERARECDAYLAQHGRPMGALHGLPISLKDAFDVEGVQTTIGYTAFTTRAPATEDSVVVKIMRDAGAVFYVKTNVPQTMMSADSHNNVFGRTLNPHNLSLTAGGSTGGEAALLAMKGSVLGIGTDIGGSVRIPALCCGTSSIKPTANRLPYGGVVSPGRRGSPGPINSVVGPLGRSFRDFDHLMKTIVDAQPWLNDESVVNVPWRTVEPAARPFRFGLVQGCKERPLHPPIARALQQVAKLLKANGHEVIPIDDKVPDLYQSAVVAWQCLVLDEEHTFAKFINASGEPTIPSLAGSTFKEMANWEPSLSNLWQTNLDRAGILRAWRKAFADEHLDAVLGCGYQATAVPHDTYGVPVYTVLQNLLNFPSGILSFGKASKELDALFIDTSASYEPPYNADTVEGAPAHVQIIGKPMMDEELIEIMKVVEGLLKAEG